MLSKNDSFFEKIFSSPPWTRCFQTPSLPCFLLISFRAFLAYFLIFFTVAIILCNDVSNPRHAPHSGALTSVFIEKGVGNSKTFCMVIFDKRTKSFLFRLPVSWTSTSRIQSVSQLGIPFCINYGSLFLCTLLSLQYLKKGTP